MVVTVKSTRPKAEILRFLSSATVYLYHVDLLSRVKGQVESLHRELSLMKAFLKVSWEKRTSARIIQHLQRIRGRPQGPGVLWAESWPEHAREVGNRPRVGPGFGRAVGQKSTGACQGDRRLSQCGSFNFSWLFGWTNGLNGINGEFLSQIDVVLPTVSGVGLESRHVAGRKSTRVCQGGVNPWSGRVMGRKSTGACQGGKRREQGIFRPNRCAMARGFGGGLGVRACCLPKIDQGMQGRLAII
ncbi:hypothetical protein FXO37_02951 [Capsicum annuum]|nr:hypothetical protein FXO37_02951 [Capsicum annuum]